MRYKDEYFVWLARRVKNKSHKMLLRFLFETNYIYRFKSMDVNRAEDGIQLRYDYIYENEIDERDFPYMNTPCNLFEMIFALAFRISLIMGDARHDDDSDIWFWRMISNMGLGKQTDRNFNYDYVQTTIRNFLNRQYGPNGRGSLFYVNSRDDISDLQIWDQAMLYLNEFEERRRPNGIFD